MSGQEANELADGDDGDVEMLDVSKTKKRGKYFSSYSRDDFEMAVDEVKSGTILRPPVIARNHSETTRAVQTSSNAQKLQEEKLRLYDYRRDNRGVQPCLSRK